MSACFAPKNIWQSPPNAHAYRLLIFKDHPANRTQISLDQPPTRFNSLRSAKPCIVAQNFCTQTFYRFLLSSTQSTELRRKRPAFCWTFQNKSLTMTYFHTGIRTIIGAKSFHGPVRDGKEWYQLAMVIRHNFLLMLLSLLNSSSEFIESSRKCVPASSA